MSLFKNAVASLGLAVACVPAALGQAALNADGFKENPMCDKPEIIKEILKNDKRYPSGIKFTTPRFNAELYVKIKSDGQPNNSAWDLSGYNKKGELCILDSSDVTPYKNREWFARYVAAEQRVPKQ